MRTLAHISDLHFGRIDPAVVEGLLVDLTMKKPDLIIISGDLVQRAHSRNFVAARAFLDRLPFPYLVVPGNHDIPVYNVLHRFIDPFRNYKRYISRDMSPFYGDSEIAVLGLNTARSVILDFSHGRLNQTQVRRICSVFKGLPDGVFKVLFTHHPFLPPPDALKTRLVDRHKLVLPALEDAGVDLLLAGHLHKAYSGELATFHTKVARSILVAQASTATSTRHRDAANPNAYNVITLDAPHLSLEVRGWSGTEFIHAAVSHYTKEGTRWVLQERDARLTMLPDAAGAGGPPGGTAGGSP